MKTRRVYLSGAGGSTATAAIQAGLGSIFEAVTACGRCTLTEVVAPAVDAIEILGAFLVVNALGRAIATTINVRLGSILSEVITRRVRANAGGAIRNAPVLHAVGVNEAVLAIGTGRCARSAIGTAAVFVGLQLILRVVNARGRRTSRVGATNPVDTINTTGASKTRVALGAARCTAAVDTALTLVLYRIFASRDGTTERSRAVVSTAVACAVCRNLALQVVRTLGTGSASAVFVRLGPVLCVVITLRLGTHAVDAINRRDRAITICAEIARFSKTAASAAPSPAIRICFRAILDVVSASGRGARRIRASDCILQTVARFAVAGPLARGVCRAALGAAAATVLAWLGTILHAVNAGGRLTL